MNQKTSSVTQRVGIRIKQLRTRKDYSQEALALSANMSISYLGQVERGLRTPTIETISKVCAALEISLTEFFQFEDIEVEDKYSLAYRTILTSLKELPPDSALRLSLIISELASINKNNMK